MAAIPEPPAIEAGLKATFTPVGTPEADRAIDESKPPEGVAVILTLPCPPGAMVAFFGVAARVKLPADTGASTSINAACGLPMPVARSYPTVAPRVLPPVKMSWKSESYDELE